MDSKASPRSIKLYRYLPDEAAINTIETSSFRVGRLAKLNDPFECCFGLDGCPDAVAQMLSDLHIAILNETDGIVCFSSKFDDPVLWSHYAKVDGEVHKGIAFEVIINIFSEDDRCIIFDVNDKKYKLYQVAYDQPRIVLPWPLPSDVPNVETIEKMKYFFRQKSEYWKYEQEYRFVVGLANCDPSGGMFLWKIPPNFVSRVIIGFRSSVNEAYLRKALKKHDCFRNTKIAKAKLSQTNYTVEVQNLMGLSPTA